MMYRMQRILIQALAEPQSGGKSLLGTIKIAVLPIAKVFTMCFLGYLMASKYVNILPANGRRLLNGLVFSLLLPCLIFSQLGQAITFEKMIEWWFIPFNIVLTTISGSIIGLVVASIMRPPYPYFKFTVVQIGIGNIGNVPLVLIAALCRDKSNPFGDTNKCSEDGNAYISFGQWVGAIVLYTYVFHMLAPPPGGYDGEHENLPLKNSARSSPGALAKDISPDQLPLLAEEATPAQSGATTKDKRSLLFVVVLLNRGYQQQQTTVPDLAYMVHTVGLGLHCIKHSVKEFLKYLYEKLKLKQIIQPPIIASILAIFIGCVPFLKKLIFTSDSPLYFFTDSCMILGEAMIPCILLALGGNLVEGPGPGSAKIGARTIAAIIFGRLVLVPPTGLGIVILADKLGFLPPNDKMFRFVLLLQHTMPTSVLSGAVANLRGCGRESASVLFWVHIFAVFSMAGWIIVYLNILF